MLVLALLLLAGSPAPSGTPAAQPAAVTPLEAVTAAHASLLGHLSLFQQSIGEYETSDLTVRLEDDISALSDPDTPDGVNANDWNERLSTLAGLDSDIVTQVVSGVMPPLSTVQGLQERLFKSNADGKLQLVAVYVPAKLAANPALVVLLHGRPQSETELLGWQYFRTLADQTGAIIVAPYGRGSYDFAQPAADDVYQLTDAAVAAFHVSPHRVFLAGYSMGGFSVFKVGPMHGTRWAGVMCISGAILNSETDSVRSTFQNTPLYVVTGAHDVNIPARYGEMTAAFLAGSGLPVEFDEEPSGTHYLSTLIPSLTRAWNDMLSGVVHRSLADTAVAMPNITMPVMNDSMRP